MVDPVVAADGFTYERDAIEKWMQAHGTSPRTNQPLEHTMVMPNMLVRQMIAAWCEQNGVPVPRIPKPAANRAAAGAGAAVAAAPLLQKPQVTCAAHPDEQLHVFCLDCDRAVCFICAVDSDFCKSHTTKAFKSLLQELKTDMEGWARAQEECRHSADELCARIQTDVEAKKQALDTEAAALHQQVRAACDKRAATFGAILLKRQEREELVAGAVACAEVAVKGSAAAAVVASALRRARADIPPACAAEFRAAAAPAAAVGQVLVADAVLDPEDEAARTAAEAATKRTVEVNRSRNFEDGWGFSGSIDALTISVSSVVAVSGISLCQWISGSTSANVDVYVIEGSSTSGRVLVHEVLRDVQLNTGAVIPLMLQQPVQLVPNADYTLALRMQGGMTHQKCQQCLGSIQSTTSAAVPFTVTVKQTTLNGPEPLNKDNSTSPRSGQIPSIYFSC
jgi:nucleoid-associated protein YgaU